MNESSKSHWHYIVYSHNGIINAVTEKRKDLVIVTVIANSENEAKKKSREGILRMYQEVKEVIECAATNHQQQDLSQEMQMLQIEMQKQMLDLLKGEHH